MSTETDPAHPSSPDSDLSIEEALELLAEIRQATADTSDEPLGEFVGLLTQVVSLHANANDAEESREIASFVQTALDEIRAQFSGEPNQSDGMNKLSDEAIERWGDRLQSPEDFDRELGLDGMDNLAGSGGWGSDEGFERDRDDSDVTAPSADEISALLTNLGRHKSISETDPELLAKSQVVACAPTVSASAVPQPTDQPTAETADVSIASLDEELREAFVDDARNCVASMEDALLRLDADPNHAESLHQICRELHTLKGASGSVGLTKLASQLHQLEDGIRASQNAGQPPCIDSLLQSVDAIRAQIAGEPVPSQPQPSFSESSQTASTKSDVAAASNFSKHESVPARPQSQGPQSQGPQSQGPQSQGPSAPGSVSPDSVAASPTKRGNVISPSHSPANFAEEPADDESVRVKSSQLNRLMDMLAELVMLRNRRETELNQLQEVYHELIGSVSKMRVLSQDDLDPDSATSSLQLSEVANDVLEVAQEVRDCARPVAEGNEAVSQFIRQFRQELVELRRTPISGLFRRLQRVVRDAAQSESKQVRLKLLGEGAGIERALQQRLYEPLLHIVRNSVCHGIESPEDRQQVGKPDSGTITLEAKSGVDLFVIEIRDDGRGLDYDAIRRRGIESGLLAADQAVSREELSQLIFHPGFSTRQSASQMAGRGVGMDVVASTLHRMRGWLEVDSEPNQGTRIRLSFPLPSVIQHAMVFRSENQLFALPMQSVQSAGELKENSICLAFSEILGVQRDAKDSEQQRIVLACDAPEVDSTPGGSGRVVLLVDEIVGPEEVVVRPLPTCLRQHPFCSGATLSGMGTTVLLVDPRRIVETQQHLLKTAEHRPSTQPSAIHSEPNARPRVLVVDDSLSARKRVVRSLSRYPVEIVEASDGKQALSILKTQRFTAVFSDMEMPHVSGMDLLAEINSGERSDPPPVVIISSRGEEEFTQRAAELGVNSYLVKPLADESLDRVLNGIPKLSHLTQSRPTKVYKNGDMQ